MATDQFYWFYVVANWVRRTNEGLILSWGWRRVPSLASELEQLSKCNALVQRDCVFSSTVDEWRWEAEANGVFSVNSVRKLLASKRQSDAGFKFLWNSWVPLKVNVFGWKASLDRIPTKEALSKCIIINPLSCSFCNEAVEDTV
ncbi:uncharacterized protein LOC110932641 [Helianthus annuus]|uniref:uncharacterized protein LOC110932641 n=1 Tax=Helianthus annuus TaxID=4232 RepID=UPI000B8FF1EA|nr:uncharacterized protein LOC110932641 [Helianthus annuus]